MMHKIKVNGRDAIDIYKWLKSTPVGGDRYLINQNLIKIFELKLDEISVGLFLDKSRFSTNTKFSDGKAIFTLIF